MPSGAPGKKEKKKPKKDAVTKAVRSSVGETSMAVEVVTKRKKERAG